MWATTRSQWRGIGIYALLFQRPLLGRPESVPPRLACAAQAPLPHPPIMVLRQLQHPDRPPEICPGTGAQEGDRGRVAHPGDTKLFWGIVACARETHGHHPPYPESHPPDAKRELVDLSLRPEDTATGADTEDGKLLPE